MSFWLMSPASNGHFPFLGFKRFFLNLVLLAECLLEKPLIKSTYSGFKFLLDIPEGTNVYHLCINRVISRSISALVFNISERNL
jgi:hypothetical protein